MNGYTATDTVNKMLPLDIAAQHKTIAMPIKKIIHSSFWLLIGNTIGRLSMFYGNILAARLLTQDGFGQYMMIRNTISLFDAVVNASLGNVAVQKIAERGGETREKIAYVIGRVVMLNLALSIVLATALIFGAELFVGLFFKKEPTMVSGLYVGSALLVFSLLSSVAQKILIGLERFKAIAFSGVITTAAALPIIFLLTTYYGFLGALFGAVFFVLVDSFVKLSMIFRATGCVFRAKSDIAPTAETGDIFRKVSFLAASAIVTAGCFWYLRVLSVKQSNGFGSVAAFDAAYQFQAIIMLITGATTSVALQMFSVNKAARVGSRVSVFKTNLATNFAIASLLSVIFSIFSSSLMSVYGSNYTESHSLVYYVSAMAILATLSSLLDKLLLACNALPTILMTVLFASAGALVFMILVNVMDGATKLACANLVFYVITSLSFSFVVVFNRCAIFGSDDK